MTPEGFIMLKSLCHATGLYFTSCRCEDCQARADARRDIALIDAGISPSRADVIVPTMPVTRITFKRAS